MWAGSRIGNKGAKMIMEALQTNVQYSVKTLDLSYNGISNPGAEVIGQMLQVNRSTGKLHGLESCDQR